MTAQENHRMKKTKLALLLLTALLVGVCIGFYGNAAIIRARIQRYSQIPANMPEHITDRLTRRLQLNDGQRAEVLKIFQAHGERMREAREQNQALIDSLIEWPSPNT
jgi:endonuclease/exonuclease/phosphatase family metal-dependent hydrolase